MAKLKVGHEETKDSGIYTRTYWVGLRSGQSPEEMEAAFRAATDRTSTLDDALARCQAFALEVLEPHTLPMPDDWTKGEPGSRCVLTLDGWLCVKVPQDADEIVHDAVELSGEVANVQRCSGETRVFAAMRLGQIIERMKVRPFEPLVMAGRKQRKGAKKGGEKRNSPYQEERPHYQQKIDEYMKEHSYDRACHLAADRDFIAEYDTIKEYTVNKRPANTGRKKGRGLHRTP